jgi:hypothetical protein
MNPPRPVESDAERRMHCDQMRNWHELDKWDPIPDGQNRHTFSYCDHGWYPEFRYPFTSGMSISDRTNWYDLVHPDDATLFNKDAHPRMLIWEDHIDKQIEVGTHKKMENDWSTPLKPVKMHSQMEKPDHDPVTNYCAKFWNDHTEATAETIQEYWNYYPEADANEITQLFNKSKGEEDSYEYEDDRWSNWSWDGETEDVGPYEEEYDVNIAPLFEIPEPMHCQMAPPIIVEESIHDIAFECETAIMKHIIEEEGLSNYLRLRMHTQMEKLADSRSKSKSSDEADKIVNGGVVSNTIRIAALIADGARYIPAVGLVATAAAPALHALARFTKYMGWDKPTSTQISNRTVGTYMSSINYGAGLDNGDILSIYPTNRATKGDSFTRQSTDELSVIERITHSSYMKTVIFTTITAAGTIIMKLPVCPWYCPVLFSGSHSPSHLTLVQSMFQHWRGSMKYRFYFVTARFAVARVRFAWLPSYGDAPIAVSDSEGDYISEDVLVEGNTIYEISIPYLQPKPYSDCEFVGNDTITSDNTNGVLLVSVSSPVVSIEASGVHTPIYMNVFYSGGEDMSFIMPSDRFYAKELVPPPPPGATERTRPKRSVGGVRVRREVV